MLKSLVLPLLSLLLIPQGSYAASCESLSAQQTRELEEILNDLSKVRMTKNSVKVYPEYAVYSAEIERPLSRFAQTFSCSEYIDWMEAHQDVFDKPSSIQKYDLKDIQLLMTSLIRRERMNSGVIANAIQKGLFTEAHTRIKKLKK